MDFGTALLLAGWLGIISVASLVGVVVLSVKEKKLANWLELMVAFAIGSLIGDVFIHLLPQLAEEGFSPLISLGMFSGIIVFFILEKVIHWHHCHHMGHKACTSFHYMSLLGDAMHNLIDGVIIAGAFLISPVAGISTAVAVLFHEVPQEIGDFGVLLKGGFSKKRALLFNFATALTAFAGAGIALVFATFVQGAVPMMVAFAAGSFLYIAGTDLFPELHKQFSTKQALLQLFFILLGAGIMAALLLLE